MPELPEVEAVCRRLRSEVLGADVVAVHIERPGTVAPQDPAELERQLAGSSIQAVRRRGKNIFIDFGQASTLHVHLRMTGNLYVVPDSRFRPVSTRAWFELGDGRGLLFDDPRALGRMRLYAAGDTPDLAEMLGPEPIDAGFTFEAFREIARGSRQPAKLFLLDQRRVAGLGNIYAAESLYAAGIHPDRAINQLSTARLRRLHQAIIVVMVQAVESAVEAYSNPDRFGEAEWFPVQVYGREGQPCYRCRRPVRRIAQGGRSTYYCGSCQR